MARPPLPPMLEAEVEAMKQISTTLSMIVLLAGLASAAQAPLTVTLTRPADMDDATWSLRKQGLASVIESGKTRRLPERAQTGVRLRD